MAKQKKNELSTANWIVKSNALNEMRHTRMTISQVRLFSIYLSKINPLDVSSREVTFKLDEYAKIMDFKRFNITQLKQSAVDLTNLTAHYCKDYADGGFEVTLSVLFDYFRFHKNEDEEWVVSINCADKVLHLMFDLKKHYFKYKLWNALQLTSPNQQRMYELLKQYEQAGAREISVKDLREFLGLKKTEYPRWERFRTRILEASQVALANHTDIKFTWEVVGKRGKGGKINTLRFNIEKNNDYQRQFTFDEYIQEQSLPIIEGNTEEFEQTGASDIIEFLSDACNGEFNTKEITLLHSLIVEVVPYRHNHYKFDMYHYLQQKYNELNYRADKTKIKSRFGYLKTIIEADK